MRRSWKAAGVSDTVRVVWAGTRTGWVMRMRGPDGGVTCAASTPDCARPVVLVTWARRVSAELVTRGALCSTTCASEMASAPELWSSTGNWMPVLLSGGIWDQSTLSSVNIVFGSLGNKPEGERVGPAVQEPGDVEHVLRVGPLQRLVAGDLAAVDPQVRLADDPVDDEAACARPALR